MILVEKNQFVFRPLTNVSAMRTPVLFAFTVFAITANAQFASDFEDWNDTLPALWGGQKTNISLDNVQQAIFNPHGGTLAVRLMNDTMTNKRLTTQPYPVDSGTVYYYNFWVRGHGDVHVSIFDERSAPGGIGTYSTYVTIADDVVWQEVSASILCTHTSLIGEYIIGVRNTVGPEHLVIDDVNIASNPLGVPTEDPIRTRVFPNPTEDLLNVELGKAAGRTDYTLTDALGRTTLAGTISSDRASIDIRSCATGLYTLGLRGASGSTYLQVVVR